MGRGGRARGPQGTVVAQPANPGLPSSHPLAIISCRKTLWRAVTATREFLLHDRASRHKDRTATVGEQAASGQDRTVEVAPTFPVSGRKPVGQPAVGVAELPLHVRWHRPIVVVAVAALGEPGREVLLDAAIEQALARAARLVPPRCAFPPARAVHACPLVERGGSRVGGRWCRRPLAAGIRSCS